MIFWHGGDLSDISNTFKQQTKRQEYGPGLYLTTSYDVVSKYIKGGRKLYRVEVALGNSLEDSDIPYDIVIEFLNELPKSISIKLKSIIDNYNKDGFISAEIINNLFVNNNLLKPEISFKLKNFYLENNIDYSLVNNAFGWGEDMMILFNTNKIINVERIGPKDKIDKFDLHKEGMEISKRQLQENYDLETLDSLNPTGSIFVDYNPDKRANSPLAKNITTLDKTIGGNPKDEIIIYRGVPKEIRKINAGDFITTNKQLAKDYAGTGNVLMLKVKKGDILDDIEGNGGEEYIYRPNAYKLIKEDMEISKKELKNQKVINAAHTYITRNMGKGSDYAPNVHELQKWIDDNPEKVKQITKGELEEDAEDVNFMGEITKGELEEAKKARTKLRKKKKGDRCTRIAKSKYDVWPSAYASGAVVKCRQGKIWKDLKEEGSFQRNLDVGREQNKNVDITNLKRQINNGLGRDMSLTPYEVVELSKLEFTVFPQQDIDKSDTNKPIILIRKRGYPYMSITDALEDANEDGFGDKPIYNLSDYYEIVDGRHRIKKAISQGKGLNAVVITEAEYEKATNTKLYSEEVQSILDDIGVDTIEKGIDFLKDYTGTEAVDNLEILTQEKILRDSDDNTINEQLDEKTDYSKEKKQGLHGWFARQGGKGKSKGWVDCNTCRDGKCKSCGRKEGESRSKYPACRPTPSACKTKGKGKSWGKKSTNEDVLNEQSKQDIERELKLNEIKNLFQRHIGKL